VFLDEACWEKKLLDYNDRRIGELKEQNPDLQNVVLCEINSYILPKFLKERLAIPEGGTDRKITLSREKYVIILRKEYIVDHTEPRAEFGAIHGILIGYYGDPVQPAWFTPRKKAGLETAEEEDDADWDDNDKDRARIPIADFVPEVPAEEASKIEDAVMKNYGGVSNFNQTIAQTVLEDYIRIRAQNEKNPKAEYIDQYFKHTYYDNKQFKKLYKIHTGKPFKSFSRAFGELSPARLFWLLKAATLSLYNMPNTDDMYDPEKMKKNEFMKFSGLAMEEYQALYKAAAARLIERVRAGADKTGVESDAEDEE
jgi:hypothetical protein